MIVIPPERLGSEILEAVIEAFVLREGTDYGEREFSLAEKIAQVRSRVVAGEVVIVFDEISESCTLLPRDELHKLSMP